MRRSNPTRANRLSRLAACSLALLFWRAGVAIAEPVPQVSASGQAEKIIIDTDIGDDIDDAFAVALALRSSDVQILGITTTFGDTEMRAKLVDRLLGEAGRTDIPVAVGTKTQPKTAFTQRIYAENRRFARSSHPGAADFILDQIKQNPGEVTLVCIGPLFNAGAAIEKDPATFRKLKRVVMMGGSINRGYGDPYAAPTPPEPEWNVVNDIPGAQKLFASGVAIYMMPLDSTQLKMDETKRDFLFRQATPLTEALGALYFEWGQQTPTLFDPMTIAFIDEPRLCPVKPMHIEVDGKGYTRAESGPANAEVCLHSDPEAFFRFYLSHFGAVPVESKSTARRQAQLLGRTVPQVVSGYRNDCASESKWLGLNPGRPARAGEGDVHGSKTNVQCGFRLSGDFGVWLSYGGATMPTPARALLVLEKDTTQLDIVNPNSLKIIAKVPVGPDPHEVDQHQPTARRPTFPITWDVAACTTS